MSPISPLLEVLQYSHPFVIERFVKHHPAEKDRAPEIFQELLKMLWLMATHKQEMRENIISSPQKILVYPQMELIDEMWHAFILFSKDYTNFCEKFFGHYLHHLPTTSVEHEREKETQASNPIQVREEIENQCRYIVDKLGIDSLTKWFKTLTPHL